MGDIEENHGIKGLLGLAGSQKKRITVSVILAAAGQALGLLPFFIVYRFVRLFSGENFPEEGPVFLMIGAGILAMCLKRVFTGGSVMLSHIAAYEILHDLRTTLARKLNTLPLGYFTHHTTGGIKKIMSEDVEQLENFFAHSLPDFIAAACCIVLTSVLLFAVDVRLALAVVSAVPLGMMIQALTLSRGRQFMEHWEAAKERMNAAMVEYIQGMPVIKTFNRSHRSFLAYSRAIADCRRLENETSRRWFLPMSLFTVSITANMAVLVPLCAILIFHQSVNLDKVIFFIFMGVGFGSPLYLMIQFGQAMERNLAAQKRINDVLEAPSLPVAKVPVRACGNKVSGENIGFSYTKGAPVIRNVSFQVPPGQFTALVGPSGSGKTTLARLAARFWDTDQGRMCIGNADVREMAPVELMDRFGLIFQDVYLFNDTVAANLKIGNPDAGQTDLETAAQIAGCHGFIRDLPRGYLTRVGENGAYLSSGEKQRISIARAILKNAPVLVLDEATAFVDPENEVLIQKAVTHLARKKTLIVIAHRLSTVTGAHEILVLNKGRIAARGPHSRLLEECPLYRKLWDLDASNARWSLLSCPAGQKDVS